MYVYFQCFYISKKNGNELWAKSEGINEKHGWMDGWMD